MVADGSPKIIKNHQASARSWWMCYLNTVRILKVKKEWYGKKKTLSCNIVTCPPNLLASFWNWSLARRRKLQSRRRKAGRRRVGLAGQPQLGAKCSQKIQKISQVHKFFERAAPRYVWNILEHVGTMFKNWDTGTILCSGDVGRQHGPCGFKLLKKILKSLSSWHHGWGLVLYSSMRQLCTKKMSGNVLLGVNIVQYRLINQDSTNDWSATPMNQGFPSLIHNDTAS